jgi:glycosyltransferase involved in cell wall biosynthesis
MYILGFILVIVFICLLVTIIIVSIKKNLKEALTNEPEVIVTIAIPCGADDVSKLDSLAHSISQQTKKPNQIVIAISGTEDPSEPIQEQISKITGIPTLVLTTSEKHFAGPNRNRAAEKSIGDYILFMDADDLMHPQYVEVICDIFQKYDPIAIVHEYERSMGAIPTVIQEYVVRDGLWMYNFHNDNPPGNSSNIGLPHKRLHHGHISIKRKVWEDGLRQTDRRRGQDAEYLRKLLDHYKYLGPKNVMFAEVPLSVYMNKIYIENHGKLKQLLKDSYIITLDQEGLPFEKVNLIERRTKEIEDSFQYYELPYRIFYSLYYDGTNLQRSAEDLAFIHRNYPWIETHKLKQNGEIGLLGGFFKLLTTATISQYLVVYEDDCRPVGTKEEFWKSYNDALEDISNNSPNVYILAYTNYCKMPCKNENKWLPGYVSFGKKSTMAGTHALIFSKKSVAAILAWVRTNPVDLPIDKFLQKLHEDGVIRLWTWLGQESNDGMFCGLFYQNETYCDSRNSIITRK